MSTKVTLSANDVIAVDKHIPMPPVAGHVKYPWTTMEIGDSFVAPLGKRPSVSSTMGRYAPKKFITHKVNEDGVDKIRVWRIE